MGQFEEIGNDMAETYRKPKTTPKRNFQLLPEEIMSQGHLACPGCGLVLALRWALKILGKETYIAAPACCFAVCDGPFPYSSSGVPLLHCAFETAAITAAGMRAGLDMLGRSDATVMAWAGDGGTFDIGIQALSGAAERNDDILYVCYDNEAYMNTGIQRSSATPIGTWTTTTPVNTPKDRPKKNMGEILAGHRIPYFATLSLAHYDDFCAKFAKAKSIKGFRFLHVFSPCPTGWRSNENVSIELSRLAVETKIFPLYEMEGGRRYTINVQPKGVPVAEYLKRQKRFAHLREDGVAAIQSDVDAEWEALVSRASLHVK